MNVVEQILNVSQKYDKYPAGAYVFIFEVLDWITISLQKKHMTGGELALAAYAYSIERYGLLARPVWEQLNLKSSEDLGQVVFHLVEEGLMGRQDSDKPEDFNGIFDLTVFDKTAIKVENDLKDNLKPTPKAPVPSLGVHLAYKPPSELKLNKN